MTLHFERANSLRWARKFLEDLMLGKYKRVPVEVREEARNILRHYPYDYEVDEYEKKLMPEREKGFSERVKK
jgi:hypothetical protein